MLAVSRAAMCVVVLVVATGCRGGLPGDPGLTFTIENRCGYDIDVNIRLPADPTGDWDLIANGASVRFAQADAEPEEFVISVRRSRATQDAVELVPSASRVTLTPSSGCPA